MAVNPQIVVEYVANTAKLQAANAQLGGNVSKAGALSRRAFLPAVAALGALGVVAGKAVKAASDLTETQNKAQVVFGKSAKGVEAWAQTTANAYGISEQASLAAASTFGDMFSQLGLGQKDAAKTSQRMVELAGDLGSFHNVDPSDVLQRVSAAFRGEYDSIQALVPNINAARVEQRALAMTHKKSAKDLTALDKAMATQAILLGDSKNAANDAAETADTFAGRQRRLAAVQQDLSAHMGQALLPVMETFAGVMQKVAAFAAKHPKLFQLMAVAVAALAASVVILNIAMAILAANPVALIILAVIAAIVALIVVVVLIRKHWDKITETLRRGWEAIKAAGLAVLAWFKRNWPLLLAIMTGPFGLAVLAIKRNWDKIKQGLNTAWSAVKAILRKIADLFGIPADAARAAADRIKSALRSVLDFLRGIRDRIGSAASSIANAIKGPINAVIGALNGLQIPAVHFPGFKTPGPIPDVPGFSAGPWDILPHIPELALGGIVTRPTVAMIGEAGPEAVVPLDAFPSRPLVNVERLIVQEPMDLQRIAASLSAAVAVRL